MFRNDDFTSIGRIRSARRPLLSREQERNLILRIRGGDQEAAAIFLDCNEGLVVNFAARSPRIGMSFGDICQAARLGILKAIEDFDLNKNLRFSTWATWKMMAELKIHAHDCRESDLPSLDDPFSDVEIEPEAFELDVLDNDVIRTIISEALMRLESKEREYLYLRFGFDDNEPMTQTAIGKHENITRAAISKREVKMLDKLRRDKFLRQNFEHLLDSNESEMVLAA
ncbi:TPA: hypothetical protein DD449_03090 [Candidatus Berkelbacteria bacterium]|uniref:RNA polymerase sigma-E factor n=1 Tax=Berkelbacteria bacterium GW2011_GWE1_39_12 TaxID=1618337 RepID=A0A0G4B3R3_9BACT|nr:MAG: RNA polymerase sigma-E factor [Berkelbacteria bacterium GW2011_GWE1_39_12]HBO60643.1 hypothetical protein [Candidatus Berkelbacteria bacterium]